MQKILNRRILRNLKKNFFRYFSLFFLIILGMYLVIGGISSAENIITSVNNSAQKTNLEDGQFTVFTPLSTTHLNELEKKGVKIEKQFYLDYKQNDNSTLRVFKNRDKINLIELKDGALAKNLNEIVLEQHYAKKHNLAVDSIILIGDEEFKVTGIGSTSDYDAPLKNITDPSVESAMFGTGFVCEEQYTKLNSKKNSSKVQELLYAYKLNEGMTSKELKKYLRDIKIEKHQINDKFLLEKINELEEKQKEIKDGITTLTNSTKDINTALIDLNNNNEDIVSGLDELFNQTLLIVSDKIASSGIHVNITKENYEKIFNDLISQSSSSNPQLKISLNNTLSELRELNKFNKDVKTYLLNNNKIANGSSKLLDGVKELQDKTNKIIDKNFKIEIENLTEFIEKDTNPRIASSIDDVLINKYAGMVSGIIVMLLFTYVISVFIVHDINQETPVIGSLYSLGVTKKQLTKHYLKLPFIITLLGGIIGTIIGFSPIGTGTQTNQSASYFSLPEITPTYPLYLIIYGIIMPCLVSLIVNYISIHKKLSMPALKMLKNDQNRNKVKKAKLKKLNFIHKFQLRQFLREMKSSFTIVLGMFLSLLILMIGFNTFTICTNMLKQNEEDTKFSYMYTYKYPTAEVPKNTEACYLENFKKETFGYNFDITFLGIDDNNKYFNFSVPKEKNCVSISSSVAIKYNLAEGDKLVVTDDVNNIDYAFTVDSVFPYSIGLHVFMDIDSMRELFNKSDDYYNVVLSDEYLDIDPDRLYATISKDDIIKSSQVFIDMMHSFIATMIGVSIMIFMLVMYLMIKVMLDRSSYNMSLMKIFGYKNKELSKLYLNSNFILIAVSALICIPLSKIIINSLFPYFISNVSAGIDLTPNFKFYIYIYLGILLCYFVISKILTLKIRKVSPVEVLKNRE